MTKDIFNKILEGGHLDVENLTPEEKKRLYAKFLRLGMSESCCYKRFFDKGFSAWEIKGMQFLVETFLVKAVPGTDDNAATAEAAAADGTDSASRGNAGYGYILMLDKEKQFAEFSKVIRNLRMVGKFCDFLRPYGMCERTVRYRLDDCDFQPWQMKGVQRCIEEFLKEEMTATVPAASASVPTNH